MTSDEQVSSSSSPPSNAEGRGTNRPGRHYNHRGAGASCNHHTLTVTTPALARHGNQEGSFLGGSAPSCAPSSSRKKHCNLNCRLSIDDCRWMIADRRSVPLTDCRLQGFVAAGLPRHLWWRSMSAGAEVVALNFSSAFADLKVSATSARADLKVSATSACADLKVSATSACADLKVSATSACADLKVGATSACADLPTTSGQVPVGATTTFAEKACSSR